MRPIPQDLSLWTALLDVVASLRAPDGCPWDREQTHRSLAPFAIEEAYELAEAIEAGDEPSIVEELGDLLLQVVLHAQVASDEKRFSIDRVIQGLNEKMVRRHPHVFGAESEAKANSSAEVLAQWQLIKAAEKAKTPTWGARFRFDVPLALPALLRSAKIGEKTSRLKFDWPNYQGVLAKVDEELNEVKQALAEQLTAVAKPKDFPETGPTRDPVASEIGDLLFSIAQLARHRGLDPEQCLREANARFERRFGLLREIELEIAKTDGRNWESRSTDELEALWAQAKEREKKP